MAAEPPREATGEAHEEQRQCPYCADFPYVDDKSGRGRFANHVRGKHPEQTEGAKARRAEEEKLTQLSPIAQRLYDTLRRVIPKGSVETIVNVFNRNSTSLGQDRHRFRSWIQRYGLTQDQLAQVEDELFGVEGATDSPGGHGGAPQIVGYMPTQGGGYQPIMVFPQAQSPQPTPNQPMIVTFPESRAPGVTQQLDGETRELLRNMTKRFDDLLEAIRQPPPARESPQPSAPMRRIPMLDEEGAILRDTAGQIIYQEVPYDPTMGTVEMMKAMAHLMKPSAPPPKEVDEEKLLLKAREQIRAEMKAEKPPPSEDAKVPAAFQKLIEDQRADLQQLSQRLSQLQHNSEIQEEIAKAMKPLQDQLADVQNRSGLTDAQFNLSHRERVAGMWQGFIQGLVGNVREDVRPMIVQSAVAGMKQMGIPDDVITQAVSSFNIPSRAGGALQGKVDEARSRWLRQ